MMKTKESGILKRVSALLTLIFVLPACVGIPPGANAVKPFVLDRYLGKWYEIARLDHRFERNMSRVTATYSLREDGSVKVENRGYDDKKQRWEDAEGKAFPVGDPSQGRLKVSFFGPFYSGYNVIALDRDYQYALVTGNDNKYLWLLSRETTVPSGIRESYLREAARIGCDTSALIWVKHGE